MTTAFYVPPKHIHDGRVVFPPDEARHAAGSLRKGEGETVIVVDGVGGWYRVQLEQATHRTVSGVVGERREGVGEPDYELTVGLSILKQRSRFETFLEKAVELGVRRIIPLITKRTEKTGLRENRARRILVAALKQSGRSWLPELGAPLPLEEFWRGNPPGQALVCHEAHRDRSLRSHLQDWNRSEPLSILVGPEGGFAEYEIDDAVARGARVTSLGERRLRAETAAIFAASAVMYAALPRG